MRRTLPLLGLVVALAGGCQQFFTTSLAAPLARPPETISSFSPDSAAAFVASLASNPDPALAASAMSAMSSLVAAHPTDPGVLTNAAEVAVIATGLDAALTEAITSVDLTALQNGSLDTTSLDSIAALVSGISDNVTAESTAIFEALAAQAASDPTGLADSGIGAQTYVVAAAALAIADITNNSGFTVAEVMNGQTADGTPVTYTPSAGLETTLSNLASGADAVEKDNPLLQALRDMGLLQQAATPTP